MALGRARRAEHADGLASIPGRRMPEKSQIASVPQLVPVDATTAVRPDRAAMQVAVEELVRALRDHHDGTAEHSNRLAERSGRLGKALGLTSDAVFELELVAILHDIGKLAVPTQILDSTRPLHSRERALVRAHTVRGAEILTAVAGLEHLAPRVRASHERWDGTGYPDRLVGESIPMAARVVFTVDAYDAMTHDRPYRRALARAEADRRIAVGAGSAFDPRVAHTLLSVEAVGR